MMASTGRFLQIPLESRRSSVLEFCVRHQAAMVSGRVVLAVSLLISFLGGAAQIPPSLQQRNVAREVGLTDSIHTLPPLSEAMLQTQVLKRAAALHLGAVSPLNAWSKARAIYAVDQELVAPHSGRMVRFSGLRVSLLNRVLRSGVAIIDVKQRELLVDEPLELSRPGITLQLHRTLLRSPGQPLSFLMRMEHAHHLLIAGGIFCGPSWAMLVADSDDVAIVHAEFRQTKAGILITNSRHIAISDNVFSGLQGPSVVLHGDTHDSIVTRNWIHDNLGTGNWTAGVVLTDRNAQPTRDVRTLFIDDRFNVVPQPIPTRLHIPQDNIVLSNRILHNRASGIYSDGSVRNLVLSNYLKDNSKEGVCLDNGSTANVVAYNHLSRNGSRWGQTDADLQRDYILKFGRLADGSSPSKVPAISMDDAAYNQILFNTILQNSGGGIKMVRTAAANLLAGNTIVDDNMGQNAQFHFFGIELGAAPLDESVVDLNALPDQNNVIANNEIRGNQYAGIFFAAGSDHNLVVRNQIEGSGSWAMESVTLQDNIVKQNIIKLRLRNVVQANASPALGSGICFTCKGKVLTESKDFY